MRGENLRFWLPVFLLLAFAVYCSQQLVRSHIQPEVNAPNYIFSQQLQARRGSIYSAYGKEYPFAKSVPFWEYRLDPVALTNAVVKPKDEKVPRSPEAILRTVSDALHIDYGRLKKMAANTSNRYQFLALSSDSAAYRTLANSRLVAGIVIEDHPVRQYLHGRMLSHVLGSINAENVGSAGIELAFNIEMNGTPGVIKGMRDARGRELYDKRQESVKPIAGDDIYLTIDHNIQFEAEDALRWGMREFGAAAGWCIVMESKTGRILAMTSMPDFEPLSYGHVSDNAKLNRAIGNNFEPGSVMKVITAAAAIDAGLVKPETRYTTNRDDSRYYKLPGDGTHVWEPTMTVRDAIVHSSNIVIGKLAYDFTPKRLWTAMRKFGFGEKTGIELLGEQHGILRNPSSWDKASWSRAGIGQFVSVTPIQLISAYQSIANDGMRMKPYIVDRIVEAGGKVKHPIGRNRKGKWEFQPGAAEPISLGRTVSEKTARTMRDMMLGVASPQGTARRAAIRGYSVAGKTGTAQKPLKGGKGYAPGLYCASFCGIVPAEDPQLVVLVSLDFEQKAKFHQGGNSAAPVFKRVTTAAIRYLSIAPDKPDELVDSYDEDAYDRVMEERERSR